MLLVTAEQMKGLGIGSLESNQANKRHKPESNGKGKGKTARSTSQETVKVNKDTLTALTRLVLKDEDSLNTMLQDSEFLLHMSPGAGSIIVLLQKSQRNKEVPLRHVLATTIMKTLEHRLATLFAAEPTTELYKERMENHLITNGAERTMPSTYTICALCTECIFSQIYVTLAPGAETASMSVSLRFTTS
jgi:hypothetical protein